MTTLERDIMENLRDRFWIWGHEAGSHDSDYNISGHSRMTPAEGAFYLGVWDYGQKCPMPLDLMETQCELGLRWLREGRIDGVIFVASCICDLGLETVEWTRNWIAGVGEVWL